MSEREIIKRLNEAVDSEDDNVVVYNVKCSDPERTLGKILEAIKTLGDVGHSCNIIIAPNTDEGVKLFYDGDGSDRIYGIESSK